MKKLMRKTGWYMALVLIFSTVIFAFSGCESYDNFKEAFINKGAKTEETVRIAVYEPLSGPDKEKGELEKIGIEIANKMFPSALGKKVELLYFDNRSDIYIAETVVEEMVDKRVAVVLGSYGSVNSLMAVSKLEEASIPAITITNTNPLVTSYNPFYFRVSYTDSFQGIGMAKYATEALGLTEAAIMKPLNNDFATAVSKSFSDKVIQITGNENAILIVEDYVSGEDDFNEILKSIKDSGAKAVFLPSTVKDAAKIITQAYKMNLELTFLGTDQWEGKNTLDLHIQDGKINIAYSTLFDSNVAINPLSDAFLRAYKAEFGKNSEPDSATALAFDAYVVAIDAINRAGTAVDGDKVREALKGTSQFKGVSGTISFDEQGDPIKSVAVKGINKGKIESIFIVEPNWVVQGI